MKNLLDWIRRVYRKMKHRFRPDLKKNHKPRKDCPARNCPKHKHRTSLFKDSLSDFEEELSRCDSASTSGEKSSINDTDDDFPLDNDDLLAEAGESEGDGSNAEDDIVDLIMAIEEDQYLQELASAFLARDDPNIGDESPRVPLVDDDESEDEYDFAAEEDDSVRS